MLARVAVLGGGASPEHEVSLVSASEVLNALGARGHSTRAVWIDPRGAWHLVPPLRGATAPGWSPGLLQSLGERTRPLLPPRGVLALAEDGVDVVFPALHGRGGEDGSVQTLLESVQLPYVGSGPTASAIGMSKLHTRLALTAAGLPMPRAFLPGRAQARRLTADELRAQAAAAGLQYPLFLKTDTSGSSLGVERIGDPGELDGALARVRKEGSYWLLEEGVVGLELTCAVLGNSGDELRALPPVQIRPRQSVFFDYASKYDGEATEELCPPPDMSEGSITRAQELALAAHDVLGCRGFSRTDMMLADSGIRILETNTIPGLTPESLVPKAARAAGISFGELLSLLLDLAREGGQVSPPLPPRRQPSLGLMHEPAN